MINTLAARTICALVALVAGSSLSADDAVKYQIDKIHFKNHGEYTMKAFVRYNRGKKNCQAQPFQDVGFARGATKTANVDNSSGWKVVQGGSACKLPIVAGEEVWGKIEIDGGENKSCRKSGSKMIYTPGGGPVTYVTAGTLYFQNRCTIDAITDKTAD